MTELETQHFHGPRFVAWTDDDVRKLGRLAWKAWSILDHDENEWLVSELGCTLDKMEIKPEFGQ